MNEKIEEKFDGLTEEEWVEKLQEWPVSFARYYKYSFQYINSFHNQQETNYFIHLSIGGSYHDIYRCEISNDEIKIKDLELSPSWILIKNIKTNESIEFLGNDD